MPSKHHFTIRDVARLAGVSAATVSAVINGTVPVSEARTKRVRDAMEALDYHADAAARSLRTGRTQVIGVMVPDIVNPYFPELIRGIEDIAAEQNYSVVVCNTNEDPVQEERQMNGLLSRRVDGFLISCTKRTAAYDRILRRDLPVVFLDQLPHEVNAPLIYTDTAAASCTATRHLIDLGHQRIAILARDLSILDHADRVEGYRRAMQQAGLPVRAEYFRVGGSGEEDGYRFGLELLNCNPLPTAVLCCNNKMLAGFLRALGNQGVRCPDQISVVGFDDHIWVRAYQPPITVVTQKSYELGQLAMRTLYSCIQGTWVKEEGNALLLPSELIVRSSTAPIASVPTAEPSN
jgi:LacI family transcriptional regulator